MGADGECHGHGHRLASGNAARPTPSVPRIGRPVGQPPSRRPWRTPCPDLTVEPGTHRHRFAEPVAKTCLLCEEPLWRALADPLVWVWGAMNTAPARASFGAWLPGHRAAQHRLASRCLDVLPHASG